MWESRIAPLSGVLFAVLLTAGFLVNPNIDFMQPEGDIVAYLQEGPVRVMTGAYLGVLAAGALLWLAGSLYKFLGRLDDDHGRLAMLAVGGGALASSLLAVGSVATVAAAERMWVVGSIEPGVAAALFDISGIAIGNGAPLGLGAMIGAVGVGAARAGNKYRWAAWVSIAVALGLISPYGWAVLALGILWVAAAGLWIYREERARFAVDVA